MLLVKIFGFTMTLGVFFTSVAMIIMGSRWQKIEASAYSNDKRPLWFWVVAIGLISLYVIALVSFVSGEKNWASWILMILLPVGWGIKGGLVVFNKDGREKVSSISGDKAWIKIALARLPVGIILAVLSLFV